MVKVELGWNITAVVTPADGKAASPGEIFDLHASPTAREDDVGTHVPTFQNQVVSLRSKMAYIDHPERGN